jgi:sulfur relay (sulfurtransferase) complex TusBCD TusD component (DsrE family)
MLLRGKKLGILVSAPPDQPGFHHALRLAETALAQGVVVYFYCIDDAVRGVPDPQLQRMRAQGAHLFACAYAAHQRRLAINDAAVYSGLSVLHDLMVGTDRFVSFN